MTTDSPSSPLDNRARAARSSTTARCCADTVAALCVGVCRRHRRQPTEGQQWAPCCVSRWNATRDATVAKVKSHVFTFSRVDFWVTVSRLSHPAIDRPTEDERGTPRFCAHALPSDPCRTGCKKETGRTSGKQACHKVDRTPRLVLLRHNSRRGRNLFGIGETNQECDGSPAGGRARTGPTLSKCACLSSYRW